MAGNSARDFLRKLGFNAFSSRQETDMLGDNEMEKLLIKMLRVFYYDKES